MRSVKIKRTAFMGLMAALIAALSFLEYVLIPPLPGLPPGVRLGLANIVVMYLLFFAGCRQAALAAVLKAGLALFMRGPVAGLLSLCGGLLSVLVIVVLLNIFGDRASYVCVSVCGACAHNLGQLTASAVILASGAVFYYSPFLLIAGIAAGTVTGVSLRILLPVFTRVYDFNMTNKAKNKSHYTKHMM
ncbi:MAG: Gx transporter family protein [Oscillospiraceae bacterium]|nr:Gx transporter family protein [Oscillospiraceae bacterium]